MEKGALRTVNESEQEKVTCNNFRLIPLDEVQTIFKLSPSLISHFHRFRRAAESDSFPSGEAKGCMIYAFTIQRTTLSHNVRADSIRPYRERVQA